MNLTGPQIAAVIFGGAIASVTVGAYQGNTEMVRDSPFALAWFTLAALLAITIRVTIQRQWTRGNDGDDGGYDDTPDPAPTGGTGVTVVTHEVVDLTLADFAKMWGTTPTRAAVKQKAREVKT